MKARRHVCLFEWRVIQSRDVGTFTAPVCPECGALGHPVRPGRLEVLRSRGH